MLTAETSQLILRALVFLWLLLIVGAFAVGIAAIPSVLFALIFVANDRGLRPDEAKAKVTYWKLVLLGTLGGVGGGICAVAPFEAAMETAAENFPKEHPGFAFNCAQCGIHFIFTVPVFVLLGSLVAMTWTRLSVRIPECRFYASVFTYRGSNLTANWIFAIAIQVAFWSLLMWGSFHLNLLFLS